MDTRRPTQTPILVSLTATALSDWRGEIRKLVDCNINEFALLLRDLPLDGRRALYRALEEIPPRSIPYAQLAADSEEWEVRYLMTKYQTSAFSLPALENAYVFAASVPAPFPQLFIENPEHVRDTVLFNETALARTNISGVCLDIAALEQNRLSDKKSYEAVINSLDHCSVGVAVVRAVSDSWYARLLKPTKRLESLKQLRYLKHFPPCYFSQFIVISVDNAFEEQLEIKKYLETLFRKTV